VHPLQLWQNNHAPACAAQVMNAGSPSGSSKAALFGAPWKQAVTGVVLAAWFYFVGWVYTYFYFRFFHIDIFEIDLPLEYIIVQATTPVVFVFGNYWLYFAAAAIVLAIVFFCIRRSGRWPAVAFRGFIHKHRRTLEFPCAALIVVALYVYGFEIAQLAANNRAQEVWISDAPEIQFFFTSDEKGSIEKSKLNELNDAYALRYLLATKDFYYVFIAEKAPKPGYVPDGLVFKVRSDAVDYVWIRRRGGSTNAL
jgi:hypothetical protein